MPLHHGGRGCCATWTDFNEAGATPARVCWNLDYLRCGCLTKSVIPVDRLFPAVAFLIFFSALPLRGIVLLFAQRFAVVNNLG